MTECGTGWHSACPFLVCITLKPTVVYKNVPWAFLSQKAAGVRGWSCLVVFLFPPGNKGLPDNGGGVVSLLQYGILKTRHGDSVWASRGEISLPRIRFERHGRIAHERDLAGQGFDDSSLRGRVGRVGVYIARRAGKFIQVVRAGVGDDDDPRVIRVEDIREAADGIARESDSVRRPIRAEDQMDENRVVGQERLPIWHVLVMSFLHPLDGEPGVFEKAVDAIHVVGWVGPEVIAEECSGFRRVQREDGIPVADESKQPGRRFSVRFRKSVRLLWGRAARCGWRAGRPSL